MLYCTTPAVVLHAQDLAEWDKLVTFFTRDFGKLRGVAKGAKRSRKRFGSGLEPFTSINLSFVDREREGLVRLDHCDIIESYPGVHGDVVKVGYANYLSELVSEMVAEREPHRELFSLFTISLSLLDRSFFREEFVRIFELRLLSLAGYQPELYRCMVCKRGVVREENMLFNPCRGGLVCATCVKGASGYPLLSGGTIKTLQRAQTIELRKITRLVFTERARRESREMLTRFIEYQLGKPLKSIRFLKLLGAAGMP